MSSQYIELIRSFVEGSISAPEFESRYLKMFKEDSAVHSEKEFQILDRLFAEVDAYVGDLPIVDPAREIDEGQLRQAAQTALESLLS